MIEMTETQLEKMAAKMPMPVLSEQEEFEMAQEFVMGNSRFMASVLVGNQTGMKAAFKQYKKYRLESRRFHELVERIQARKDIHRGTYWVYNLAA
ncbi:MAG: hypothetical protein ACK528_13640 [Alphaproteobacteria bacterium]|jgi:hypothetical protein